MTKYFSKDGMRGRIPARVGPKSNETYTLARRLENPSTDSLLLQYHRVLKRWRLVIAACAAFGGLGGLLMTVGSVPVYRARTSLDIQTLNDHFLNIQDAAPTGEGGDSGDSSVEYIQTQIKLLQSDTLRDRTVRRLRAEPHPDSFERTDVLSSLARIIHLSNSKPLAYDEVLNDAAKHVTVKPIGLSRLVEVTCDSWDAEFSSKFCNTLTSEFQVQDREVRQNEASKTSEWLTAQVADVRAKVKQSEADLEKATGGNGLVLSQENASVSADRLRQMQSEMLAAKDDRIAKQAQYDATLSTTSDTLPSVLDNPTFRADQSRLEDLRSSVAALVPPLTEENPKVIHLRSQIAEVEADMAEQRGTIVTRMKNEFQVARQREGILEGDYHVAEQGVSSELANASRVSLLRKEVESEQQLYQTLLQRAKEAGFAAALQVTTTRIVDAAAAPKQAISPRPIRTMALGVILGSFLGVLIAFVRERTSEVFRSPGDSEQYLNLRELGVVPNDDVLRKELNGGSAAYFSRRGPPNLNPPGKIGELNPSAVRITTWQERFSLVAEAYRSMTYSIFTDAKENERGKVYVVSSPNASEGKTTVVSNLGVSLSQMNKRVVLIDGDMRKPGLHKTLGVSNETGLRNLLQCTDIATSPIESFCKKTAIPNLWVIPSGRGGGDQLMELLHSPQIVVLMARLSREFDVILVDTPPMLHIADARVFAGYAKGVILVFRSGVTQREAAIAARDIFEHDRAPLMGTILNDFDPVKQGKNGYYESYVRYQQDVDSTDQVSAGA
jgi:polysaccharide biosynthesis transport protein